MTNEATDSTDCPKCGKNVNQWDDDEEYWQCDCGFKFDEGGEEYTPCTHDGFTVWIVETRKRFFDRNQYTGELEETGSRAWESDWSTITCECGECSKDLDEKDICKASPRPEGWRPNQNVYEVETVESPTIRFTRRVLADSKHKAWEKALKGEGEIINQKELECDHKEMTSITEVVII